MVRRARWCVGEAGNGWAAVQNAKTHPPAPTTKPENTKQFVGAGRVERTVRHTYRLDEVAHTWCSEIRVFRVSIAFRIPRSSIQAALAGRVGRSRHPQQDA